MLGLDDFPIKFLKECWEVVGSDAIAALEAFFLKEQ